MISTPLKHWPAAAPVKNMPPLLLVPGAFNSIRLWEDRFAPSWAAAGIDTWAMDFRSDQAGPFKRHTLGLKAFQADLKQAIEQLPAPPVVLGYSLGGRVLLEFAANNEIPGMILLNALPNQGVPNVLFGYARSVPLSLAKLLALAVVSPVRRLPGRLPDGIASAEAEAVLKKRFVNGLRGESLRVLTESLGSIPAIKNPPPAPRDRHDRGPFGAARSGKTTCRTTKG